MCKKGSQWKPTIGTKYSGILREKIKPKEPEPTEQVEKIEQAIQQGSGWAVTVQDYRNASSTVYINEPRKDIKCGTVKLGTITIQCVLKRLLLYLYENQRGRTKGPITTH